MKQFGIVLALVLGFIGFIGFGSAEAAFVTVGWRTGLGVVGITNPQMYQRSVFTMGNLVGPNFPPIKGGNIVILDITDRTSSQLLWLGEVIQNNQEFGRRYGLRFTTSTQWMKDQLYKRGFITTTWNQIRGLFWDRELKRRIGNVESLYAHPGWRLEDDCNANCDYEACAKLGTDLPNFWCDCEVYDGRTFCHKKNFFIYSDILDH